MSDPFLTVLMAGVQCHTEIYLKASAVKPKEERSGQAQLLLYDYGPV